MATLDLTLTYGKYRKYFTLFAIVKGKRIKNIQYPLSKSNNMIKSHRQKKTMSSEY